MTEGNHGSRYTSRVLDAEAEHTLKNHVAIIVGYCELLLTETAEDDPRRGDLLEMQQAANAILAMFAQGKDQ